MRAKRQRPDWTSRCDILNTIKTRVLGGMVALAACAGAPAAEQSTALASLTAKDAPANQMFFTAIAPWSAEHPRNDHTQIFRLRNGDLMFRWFEYYVNRPSGLKRNAYEGYGRRDGAPCRISLRVSADAGRSWSGRGTLQDNVCADNVKQQNLVRCAKGDVLMFLKKWDFKAQGGSVHCKRSADDAETWMPAQPLTPPGGTYILDAGRILHGFVGPRHSTDLLVAWDLDEQRGNTRHSSITPMMTV